MEDQGHNGCPECSGEAAPGHKGMEPPTIPVAGYRSAGHEQTVPTLSGGVRLPPGAKPQMPGPAEIAQRLGAMLSVGPDGAQQLDPNKAGPGMAFAAMVSNLISRCQLEIAALKLVLTRRGLITDKELMDALAEVNAQFNATMDELQSHLRGRPAAPPRQPQRVNDPRRAPR